MTNVLSSALRDGYVTALDSDIGLKLASEWQPDTSLLDIEMPVKNGYEVCKALKPIPSYEIFLSSLSLQNPACRKK